MCPINSRTLIIPFLEEEFTDDEVEDTIYCQIISGFIHKDTDAAACVHCYFRMDTNEKLNWVSAAKHLLIIGEDPIGVECSLCNLNRLTTTRDPRIFCLRCQLSYLRYLNGTEFPYIDSDGNTVIPLFHLVNGDFTQYGEYFN